MLFFKKNIFFFLLLACFSCQKKEEPKALSQIFVTTSPYQVFIGEMTKGFAETKTIVPLNQNPHFFSPSIKEVSALAKADMIFLVGETFEQKILPSIIEKNPSVSVINLTKTLSLIPIEVQHEGHSHSHMDIHVWLSPKLVAKQIAHIKKALINKFPEKEALIAQRAQKIQDQLLDLNQKIDTLSLKNIAFFSSHEAFAYFCKDFQCEEYPLEFGQKSPTAKHLEKLLLLSKDKAIHSIVIIPHLNDQGAHRLAKHLSIQEITFDPFSPQYFDNLYTLALKLKEQKND